jgi:hypothetical protein
MWGAMKDFVRQDEQDYAGLNPVHPVNPVS